MTDEFTVSSYIHIYNECALLHTHADDHMKNLKLNTDTVDDIDKFQNQKSADIKLYLFFEILAECTHNEHAIKLKNSDNLNSKRYQS